MSNNRNRRSRLGAKYGVKCWKCGTRDGETLDHFIPKSFLGSGMQDNLRLACKPCNAQRKNQMTLSDLAQVAAHEKPTALYRRPKFRGWTFDRLYYAALADSEWALSTKARQTWQKSHAPFSLY